jgi:hypothetical protein
MPSCARNPTSAVVGTQRDAIAAKTSHSTGVASPVQVASSRSVREHVEQDPGESEHSDAHQTEEPE